MRDLLRELACRAEPQLLHPAALELRPVGGCEHVENRRAAGRSAVRAPPSVARLTVRARDVRGRTAPATGRPGGSQGQAWRRRGQDRSWTFPRRREARRRPDPARSSSAPIHRRDSRSEIAAIRPIAAARSQPSPIAWPDRRSSRPCRACPTLPVSGGRNRSPPALRRSAARAPPARRHWSGPTRRPSRESRSDAARARCRCRRSASRARLCRQRWQTRRS